MDSAIWALGAGDLPLAGPITPMVDVNLHHQMEDQFMGIS